MRPLLIVVGLAFAATVLITDVGAIKCYLADNEKQIDWTKERCLNGTTHCVTMVRDGKLVRLCGASAYCDNPANGTDCCHEDYCNGGTESNGDATSIQPVSLLIAVVVSAIAAVGI
ncbi:hypothetical protein AAVH_36231 [Aphelenchoides avenae]|nr:hypothetical protein AAVH_36231 [Aphelenchus avenae]